MNVNKLLQRSYNAWKRPLALLMAFLMIFACLPVNGLVYADSEPYSIDVTIRTQAYGRYMHGFGSQVTVSSDLSERYGYTDSVEDGVSALDVLIRAHQLVFDEDFNPETAGDFLEVGSAGFATKLFGKTTSAFGFLVNSGYPNDGTESGDGYRGTTINETLVEDAGVVDFFIYQDGYALDEYSYVEVPKTVTVGKPFDVTVNSICVAYYGYKYRNAAEMKADATATEDAGLAWVDSATGALTVIEGKLTDENGKATITAPAEEGTYYLTAITDMEELDPVIIMNPVVVNVCEPSPVDADVTIRSQAEGAYLDGFESTVPVSADIAENYGYTDTIDMYESVSALDVLVKAHERIFGSDFTKETAGEYLVVSASGSVSKLFGEETPANGFLVNGGYPNDGTASSWGGYNGTMVNSTKINKKDVVDFFIYQDTSAWSDRFSYVEVASSVKACADFDATVKSVAYMDGYKYKNASDMKAAATVTNGAGLAWVELETGETTTSGITIKENGSATVKAPATEGTYYLTAINGKDNGPFIIMNPVAVEVYETPEEPLPELTFTASVDGEELTDIDVTEDAYTYIDWKGTSTTVALHTITIPEGTGTVDFEFSRGCLPYNYGVTETPAVADDSVWIEPMYDSAIAYGGPGITAAAIKVDANEDGTPDYIQVQNPFNADYSGGAVQFAITFMYTEAPGKDPDKDPTPDITAAEIMHNIAAKCATSGVASDDNYFWFAADMMAYLKTFPATENKLSESQIDEMAAACVAKIESSTAPGDLAKAIIALTALGYDSQKITDSLANELNAVKKLADLVDAGNAATKNVYTIPYEIIAFQQFGNTYAAQIKTLKDLAVSNKASWLSTSWGTDGATPMVLALAPYKSEAAIAEVLTAAETVIRASQKESGFIGNAASTGLAMAAFAAIGVDPAEVKFEETGKSLTDAIVLEVTESLDGFKPTNNTFNTEQGLRGLIAAENAKGGKAYRIYDFSGQTLKPIAAAVAVENCLVKVSVIPASAAVTVTNAGGAEVEPISGFDYDLTADTYTITASSEGYVSKNSTITVSDTDAAEHAVKTVDFSLVKDNSSTAENITITVKVMVPPSDTSKVYSYKSDSAKYTNLISSGSKTEVAKGTSARDVLVTALDANDITYTEKSDGYFPTINGLSEFDRGENSGWMYMVNGKQPDVAAKDYTFNSNATMIWFYTDDWTKESGSEQFAGGGGAGGTAKDDVIVEPNAKVNGNTASANVTEKQITDAITEANKAKADEIIIAPKETGKAAQIEVTLPAAAAAKVAGDAKASLTVDTVSGDVSIPADALASIAGQAGKRDITISIEAKPVEKTLVKDAGENAVAVNVTIKAGEEKITSFGGKSITIDIPVTNSYKSGEKYLVLEVSDNGSQKVLTGKCSGAADSRVVSVSTSGLSDFVVTTINAELPFTDVAENAYYRSAVAWALDKGITSGTSKTKFSPDASCTRAQMATFLWVAAGKPEPASASCSFTDVKPGDYFYKPVLWMVENGLTSGVSKTAFGSDAPCTRAQMAVFLYKFNKVDTMEIKDNPFSDVKEGAYYYDAVLWAAKNGITSGTGKGTFSPDAVCTRAQMVTFLFNYLVK